MKTTHLSILFAIASLVSGQAAAITVDTLDGGVVSAQESTAIVIGDFDRMNPNGRESDGTSPVLSANDGDSINQWVAIDVVALNALSDINATADATSGTVSFPFLVNLYRASVAGDLWTVIDDDLGTTGLQTYVSSTSSPLKDVALSAGQYLLQYTTIGAAAAGGTDVLPTIGGDNSWDYSVRISSVVPVPAAVWLFGTALAGLMGFRRKAQLAA